MSGLLKSVTNVLSKFDPIGILGGDDQLKEAKRAAEAQAQATRDAAEAQAQATRDAATQQAQSLQQQAVASAQAQQATINQAAVAAQQAAQLAAEPQEGTPDVQLGNAADSSDPRRKYQGSSASPVGGTSGGIGIRL